MYSKCCSGNFSSCSLGSSLRYRGSFCGLSYPSKLVYSPDLCSPSSCQLRPVYSGCQETCYQTIPCRSSCVVSNPCQTSCCRPRTPILYSPCQTTYTRSLGCGSRRGCGSRSSCSLRCGSRSCYSLGCGSAGFRSLGCGIRGVPFLGYRSGLYRPCYSPSSCCQSSC